MKPRNWLETSGRDGFVIGALTAEETRPRRTFHGDRVMLKLLGIDLDHGAEPKDMLSVRLGLEGKRSIGIWVRALQAVRNLTLWIKRTPSPLET